MGRFRFGKALFLSRNPGAERPFDGFAPPFLSILGRLSRCVSPRGARWNVRPASRDERTALRFTPRPIRSPGFLKDTLLRSMTVFLRSCLLVLGIALVWSASPVHAQGFLQSPSRP